MTAPLSRLADALWARPLALAPASYAAISRQLADAIRARLEGRAAREEAEILQPDDGKGDEPRYRVEGGVAVVEMRGVMGRHLSQLAMACGGCDVDRVMDALAEADEDPAARAVVLLVDSPGGSVAGVAEAARRVREMRKFTVAVAPDLCASAAYWIASQADALYVGETACVGSVGVYCALLDSSERYAREGYRVDVFRSGENKGAGIPGTSLTDAQREQLQAEVDSLAAIFKRAVKNARPAVADDLLDGRTLTGEAAVEAGLADAVGNLTDAIADAAETANMPLDTLGD